MKTKKRFMIAGSVALLLAVLAGSMIVEARSPGRWFGRDSREGPWGGCFHPGFQGGGDMSDFVLWRMDERARELNLNAAQKEQYDKLRASVKSRLAEVTEGRKALKGEVRAEMAKEIPDVEALAPKLKTAINGISVTMQETIDLFVAFNGSLDNDQKKKLAKGFRDRMAR